MWIVDGLQNLISGLGGGKDKNAATSFVLNIKTPAELNAMHRSDWLARKVVDIIPNDMTRAWRDWQADGAQIEKIEAVEKAPLINVRLKVNQALQTARLFGGAVIYIGIKNANPEDELDPRSVGQGDLHYLHVLSRHEVTAAEVVNDVTSEFYGLPAYYEIRGASGPVKIHPSRMVRFEGAPVLDRRATGNETWGDSILQVVYDALQNAGSAQGHIAALIPEAKVDIVHVPGLSQHTKTEQGRKLLLSRFEYANTLKSMMNTVLIDGNGQAGAAQAGEKWEQKQISFAQLPELMRQYLSIAAAAADVPATRLLSESPGGLNTTGESDLRNHYDNIAARQVTELQPALNRLDEVIIRSALGARPKAIYYEWAPLWGMSEKEKAEVFKAKADAARALAGTKSGPLLPVLALSDALVNTFTEDGSLPGLEAAIAKHGPLVERPDPADTPADKGGQTEQGGDTRAADAEGGGRAAASPFDARRRKHGGHLGPRKGFDPNQPRGGDGRWIPTGRKLEAAIACIGRDEIMHVPFAAVRRPAELSRAVGMDVRGFKHSASNQSMAHVLTKHGGASEKARGQVAVTKSDFGLLPLIVRTGKYGPATERKLGPPRVTIVAQIDGVTFTYVAEVRRRQRRLDMISMWKK